MSDHDENDRWLQQHLPQLSGEDPLVRQTVQGAVARARIRQVVVPWWSYASVAVAVACAAMLIVQNVSPSRTDKSSSSPSSPIAWVIEAGADDGTEFEDLDWEQAEASADLAEAPDMLEPSLEDLSDGELDGLSEELEVESWNG